MHSIFNMSADNGKLILYMEFHQYINHMPCIVPYFGHKNNKSHNIFSVWYFLSWHAHMVSFKLAHFYYMYLHSVPKKFPTYSDALYFVIFGVRRK